MVDSKSDTAESLGMIRTLLLCIALVACAADSHPRVVADASQGLGADADEGRDSDAAAFADASASATDFRQPGPFTLTQSAGTTQTGGCNLSYQLFTPSGGDASALVVLGHGFQRSAAQMQDMATHIASYGVRVVTPEFCHSSFLDTDHEQNGLDAAALATELAGSNPVIFAGHSAGGLAALVAASESDNTLALLSLDLVDSADIGNSAAANLDLPWLALAGEPDSCNSNGNGLALLAQPHRVGVRIQGANHCDFEGPSSGTCTAFCGAQSEAPPLIRALAAAFVAWQLNLDATGEDWASPSGAHWQELVDQSLIETL